ncbi:MAG: response regulator [Actinobacteria bacterium]|nr:response regulator [Actinomycetota bacterium]
MAVDRTNGSAARPVRVLVVDDSAVMRRFLQSLIGRDPTLKVVGVANDGRQAVDMAAELKPDVISMDVTMPILTGVEATGEIMRRHPTPIVLVTAEEGVREDRWVMTALATGAISAIPKPSFEDRNRGLYVSALKSAANARRFMGRPASRSVGTRAESALPPRRSTAPRLVVVAASAGGPKAIERLLTGVTADFPAPILFVQHIAENFQVALVDWLARTTGLVVDVGGVGRRPRSGAITVAPEDRHLVVEPSGEIAASSSPAVNGFRPSATELFRTATLWRPERTWGFVLSGMGNDSTAGTRSLISHGGRVFAQDQESCTVYGMPAMAVEAGAESVHIDSMNQMLRELC